MSKKTHGMHSIRRFATAAAGLALLVTAAATRPLYGQVSQDSATKNSPWDLPPSPPRTGLPQATGQAAADTGRVVADTSCIREVGSMNLLEVRLGTLAGQRSSNSTVKQFGQQMVSSHSSMGQQWASLAEQNRLPTSAPMNSIQQRQAEHLSKLSGTEFDRAYMEAMVADHEQDAGVLQRIGTYAQSAEVKRLAASGLVGVQQHLSRARQIASQVGAATAVVTNP